MRRATWSSAAVLGVVAVFAAPVTGVPVASAADPVPTCMGKKATIVGTPGDDDLVGTLGDDVIVGLGGYDVIRARAGNDIVCGGDKNDVINGGQGNDTIDGGVDNDVINGGEGNDRLDGGPGDDTIRGGTWNDTIRGRSGNDVLHGQDGGDTISGGVGDDTLRGGSDSYLGDISDRYAFPDRLRGGPGNDLLAPGQDDILADSDLDWKPDVISFADSPAGVKVDLDAGVATGEGNDTIVLPPKDELGRYFPIEIQASRHEDSLVASQPGSIVVFGGGAGNDRAEVNGLLHIDEEQGPENGNDVYVSAGRVQGAVTEGVDKVTATGLTQVGSFQDPWLEVGGTSRPTITLGAADDHVQLATNNRVVLRTGAGADRVRLQGTGSKFQLAARLGSGDDRMGGSRLQGRANVTGGEGVDVVKLNGSIVVKCQTVERGC